MTTDHAQSPRLGQPTAVENPGVQLVTLLTLPEVAYRGQIVYLLDRDEFRVNDGVAWQNPTAAAMGGTQTFVGATAPAADAVGDLWMNNTTNQLYVWSGVAWVPVVDPAAQAAATAASAAQAAAESALTLATGKTTVWYMTTQPSATTGQTVAVGDLWVNTTTNRLYQFTTITTVVEIQDTDIAAALAAAGTAQVTADSKIVTYTQPDAPTGLTVLDVGDLWFDTDADNKCSRWSGTDWIDLVVGSDAIASGSVDGTHLAPVVSIGSTVTTRTLDSTGQPTGPGLDINPSGLFTFDNNGSPRVELPNDPLSAQVFRGDAEIDHLTVNTLTTLQSSQIAQGSTLTMQTNVTRPSQPPTISIGYTTTTHSGSGWTNKVGFGYDGTSYYVVSNKGDGGYLEKWDSTGALVSSVKFTTWTVTGGTWIAGTHNTYVAIVHDPDNAARWQVQVGCEDGTPTVYPITPFTSMSSYARGIALGWDSASDEILLAQSLTSVGDIVRIWRCTYPTGANASPMPGQNSHVDSSVAYPQNISHILYGSFDFGSARYILGNYGNSPYIVLTSTGALYPNDQWDMNIVNGTLIGMIYNGTRFVSISNTGYRQTYEVTNKWTASSDGTWYAAYSWTNTGVESRLSSPVSFSMKKRSRLTVYTSPYQSGTTGTNVYLAKGSTAPNINAASMTLVGATTGSPPRITTANALFTPLNNLTASTFSTGASSAIASAAIDSIDALVVLRSDGTGRLTHRVDFSKKMQTGLVTITPTTVNVTESLTVTFPTPFDVAPYVVLGLDTGTSASTGCIIWPGSITTTSFSASVNRGNLSPTTMTWIAMTP